MTRTRRTPWLAIASAVVVIVAAALLALGGRGRRRDLSVGDGGGDAKARSPGSAIVEVASVPAGARVLEDGRDRGVTPLVLPVAPGREVVIELVLPGHERARRVVTASAGEPVSIRIELTPSEFGDGGRPAAGGFAPPADAGVR